MEARDKFSTKENFATLIRLQTEFIDDCKKDIQNLKDSEDKGIQLYSLPNKEVIQNKHETILMYEYDNLLATYSMGESINKILPLYKEIVSLMPMMYHPVRPHSFRVLRAGSPCITSPAYSYFNTKCLKRKEILLQML